MPEGDTIFRTARALNRAIGRRIVTGFETSLAPLSRVNDDASLVGRMVERVEARGKWCLIFFSGDLILLTHMRMSGSWHIYKTGERWQAPRSAMRIVIRLRLCSIPVRIEPCVMNIPRTRPSAAPAKTRS